VRTASPAKTDGVEGDDRQVITLRLQHLDDMFILPAVDLFSEYRNFLTGIDFCISTLRGRHSRRPVRLEITLPPDRVEPGQSERVSRTLRRYCDHRMGYNSRERRAVRFDGVSAMLRAGLALAVAGLLIMAWSSQIEPADGVKRLVTDHFGFVLAWLGLWFPLDQFFFYPLAYGRENRVLLLLREAEVTVAPYDPALHPAHS
jgi:hypothetical protein